MSLVFSAIAPHPPVLIPSIGKDNLEQIEHTVEALKKLEQDLYAAKPEILIIISPHGEVQHDAFGINLSNTFDVNFESFGDFSTKLNFKGDTTFITSHKEMIASKIPINIISEKQVDHGVSVPLFALAQNLPDITIVPISFSLLDNKTHLEFGKTLKEAIMDSDKRIAIIASGDLSHCLNENAPAPFKPEGKKFDESVIEYIKKGDIQSLVSMDYKLIEKAAECGLRSIIILMGVLSEIKFKPEILSYEAPFGVGYLVANFEL